MGKIIASKARSTKAISRWEGEGGAAPDKPEASPRAPKAIRLDYVAADFSIDRLADAVTLIIRTGDDVDHAFLFDPTVFSALGAEIIRLQAPPHDK